MKSVAVDEVDRPFGERAEPDLGSLQVDQDPDPAPRLVGGLANQPVDALVLGVAAVAQVEAGDVHPGLDQLADALRCGGSGTEGADNLGSAHPPSLFLLHGRLRRRAA